MTGMSVLDRIRGCLLGGAIGDALGAQTEFSSTAVIDERFGRDGPQSIGSMYGRSGAFTDDTQMTLFTAEGLIRAELRMRGKGVCDDKGVVLHAYLRWLHLQGEAVPSVHGFSPESFLDGWLVEESCVAGPRAPGNTCLSALRSGLIGTVENPINDSKGCGAVMRMAPAGLFFKDLDTAFNAGVNYGALTHGHPSGYLPAGMFAAMICSLLSGASLPESVEGALALVARRPGHDETTHLVRAAIEDAGNGTPEPDDLERIGEGGWWGSDALAIAIRVVLSCNDPRDALVCSVHHGGDSDSTGSLVGNLIGAHRGEAALPTDFLEQLDGVDVITAVAEDLAAARDHSTSLDPLTDRYPGW